MEKLEIISKVKLGRYTKVVWKTTDTINNSEFTKISSGVVRFLGKKEDLVKTSQKKNIDYIRLFLTNNKYHRAHTLYFKDGVEISEIEYYQNVEKKEYNITTCFSKHLEDIIKIGD